MRATGKLPRVRGRWIVVIAVLALALGSWRLADQGAPIHSYRTVNDRTLVVTTVTGSWTWTRVTSVVESSASVTIAVSSISAPLAGFGDDIQELSVTLHDPLGNRTVIDATSGLPIPRT